jgi:hypothetical protein
MKRLLPAAGQQLRPGANGGDEGDEGSVPGQRRKCGTVFQECLGLTRQTVRLMAIAYIHRKRQGSVILNRVFVQKYSCSLRGSD